MSCIYCLLPPAPRAAPASCSCCYLLYCYGSTELFCQLLPASCSPAPASGGQMGVYVVCCCVVACVRRVQSPVHRQSPPSSELRAPGSERRDRRRTRTQCHTVRAGCVQACVTQHTSHIHSPPTSAHTARSHTHTQAELARARSAVIHCDIYN
jgi:hypothetical protein